MDPMFFERGKNSLLIDYLSSWSELESWPGESRRCLDQRKRWVVVGLKGPTGELERLFGRLSPYFELFTVCGQANPVMGHSNFPHPVAY
jgi:hypothetical protein